jgi:hypothetical protein
VWYCFFSYQLTLSSITIGRWKRKQKREREMEGERGEERRERCTQGPDGAQALVSSLPHIAPSLKELNLNSTHT